MSQLLDRQYALKILKMLSVDFKDMDAYKLGIIDKDGKVLRKTYQLRTQKERDAYNYLTRLVVILKKIISAYKQRGDITLTRQLVPAYWIVREQLSRQDKIIPSTKTLTEYYDNIINSNITFVEEQLMVESFLDEEGEGGAPTNNTGGVAALTQDSGGPAVHQKDIKKFQKMARRSMPSLKTFLKQTQEVK